MTKAEREPTIVPQSPEARPETLSVLTARAACALEASQQSLRRASDQNLGHLEPQAEQDVRELLRQTPGRGKIHFLCAPGRELILRHGMTE